MNDPTQNLIVLLVVIPMAMGLLCILLVNHRMICRGIGLVSFAATFALSVYFLISTAGDASGVLVSQMGDWPAPFGITLVFDSLSGLLLASASLVALCSYLHSFSSLTPDIERRYYHPLINLLMMGVNLSFLTGDLFNLFVAFEVMLMASYALLVLGGGAAQLRQAYKYVVLNLVASAVFVAAAGMVYGMLGTLNMADLARLTEQMAATDTLPTGFTALSVLFLFVFALKAGVFPLWFWLPDTYPTLPIAVAALFGGVLTKVGLYAIARTFPMIFLAGDAAAVITPILAWSAALTMALGVLGAMAYPRLRRVLCLLIIVGVGYPLFGIAVGSGAALSGSVFYMAQSMIVLCAAFLLCGQIERQSGTDELAAMGGLVHGRAWLAVGFFIIAMALVGLPPTSGFWGKLVMVREGLTPGFWPVAVVAMIVGAFTLLAVLRAWSAVFWGPRNPVDDEPAAVEHNRLAPSPLNARLAVGLLVVTSLGMGILAQPIWVEADRAGRQLTDTRAYRQAVLHNPRYEMAEVQSRKSKIENLKSEMHP